MVKCAPHRVQSVCSQLNLGQSLPCCLAKTNSSDASAHMTRQGILTPTRLLLCSMAWSKKGERETEKVLGLNLTPLVYVNVSVK